MELVCLLLVGEDRQRDGRVDVSFAQHPLFWRDILVIWGRFALFSAVFCADYRTSNFRLKSDTPLSEYICCAHWVNVYVRIVIYCRRAREFGWCNSHHHLSGKHPTDGRPADVDACKTCSFAFGLWLHSRAQSYIAINVEMLQAVYTAEIISRDCVRFRR